MLVGQAPCPNLPSCEVLAGSRGTVATDSSRVLLVQSSSSAPTLASYAPHWPETCLLCRLPLPLEVEAGKEESQNPDIFEIWP